MQTSLAAVFLTFNKSSWNIKNIKGESIWPLLHFKYVFFIQFGEMYYCISHLFFLVNLCVTLLK